MKKIFLTLLLFITTTCVYADILLFEGFEYGNHDGETPVGWNVADNTWLTGYLQQDHSRAPHSGNWYAYTNATESWMFMGSYLSEQLKYRFSLWAITDGGYQLEIWGGNNPDPSAMTQIFLSTTVNTGNYEKFSAYVDEIASNYEYFGIHAASSCSDCVLTIDDIQVDVVGRYEIVTDPVEIHSIMPPGSQSEFSLTFFNLGYEPANVIISPISESFTDVHLYIDGTACTTFHVEPNEMVDFTGVATLRSDVEMGESYFVDIMFTLDCDCATTMFTFWATAGNESLEETDYSAVSIYPNPSKGSLTIEGNGTVTITNSLGQEVLRKQISDKEYITLEKGIYFVRKDDGQATKIIVE